MTTTQAVTVMIALLAPAACRKGAEPRDNVESSATDVPVAPQAVNIRVSCSAANGWGPVRVVIQSGNQFCQLDQAGNLTLHVESNAQVVVNGTPVELPSGRGEVRLSVLDLVAAVDPATLSAEPPVTPARNYEYSATREGSEVVRGTIHVDLAEGTAEIVGEWAESLFVEGAPALPGEPTASSSGVLYVLRGEEGTWLTTSPPGRVADMTHIAFGQVLEREPAEPCGPYVPVEPGDESGDVTFLERYRSQVQVDLIDARDGQPIARETFRGHVARCPERTMTIEGFGAHVFGYPAENDVLAWARRELPASR